ncbi:MAG: tetratricopeptide repeat protein [Timaviella obliquedivisa GSE-PSE-MK23-08B]|nr:tetratricopeptide repeat protein [Timaviella obliquedivisa GSE-PSE-MK23-08B]
MERQPIEVFFSYSREDKPLRDKLEVHLSGLKRQGVISSWHDREIVAGSEWEEEIDRHMRTADVILLLISPAFVASRYCYEIELPDAMARHEAEEACVVPILLQEVVGWQKLPFAKLQVYPSGGTPLADWRPQRKAFENVVEGIEKAVKELLAKRQEQDRLKAEKLRQEQEERKRCEEQERLRAEQVRLKEKAQARQEERKRQEAQAKQGERERQEAQEREERRAQLEDELLETFESLKSSVLEFAFELESFYKRRPLFGFMTAAIGVFLVVSAFSSSPRTAESFFNRGLEKQNQKEGQAAIADFDEAIRLKPDYVDAYYSRGNIRYVLSDNKGAIADLDQAIKLKPDYADAYYIRGNAYYSLGDNTRAIADYDRAIKLKTDLANAFYGRGNARSALGDKSGAIADLQKAVDLYQKQGDSKEWRQNALNRLKELQP